MTSLTRNVADRPVVVPFCNQATITPASNIATVDITPANGTLFGSRINEMGDLYRFYRPRALKVTIFPTLAPDPFFGTMQISVGMTFGTGGTAPTGLGGFEFVYQTRTGSFRTTPTVLAIRDCLPHLNVDWFETEAAGVPSTDTAGSFFFLNESSATGSFAVQWEGVIEFMGTLDPTVSLTRLMDTCIPKAMPEEIKMMHLRALGLVDSSEDGVVPVPSCLSRKKGL